jgi:hypothetical protein
MLSANLSGFGVPNACYEPSKQLIVCEQTNKVVHLSSPRQVKVIKSNWIGIDCRLVLAFEFRKCLVRRRDRECRY